MSERTHVDHPLEPIFDGRSRALVLGTMPSPASRAARFYYGHPQNRFWRVIAALWNEPVPETNDERIEIVLRHRIALWDVLASCDIAGASDASIANPRHNDLARVIDAAPIEAIFTTGAKAASLYRKLCAPQFAALDHIALPSTSGANARMRLADLIAAYEPLRRVVDDEDFI